MLYYVPRTVLLYIQEMQNECTVMNLNIYFGGEKEQIFLTKELQVMLKEGKK